MLPLVFATAAVCQDSDPATANCPTAPSNGALAVCVPTYHNQNSRKGLNFTETKLTKAVVTAGLSSFTDSVSGQVYAQPLFLPAVNIAAGVHNVVYVATETNDVYAFDGDASQTTAYWHVNLTTPPGQATRYLVTEGPTPPQDISCNNVQPSVGITGTPVINITSQKTAGNPTA